MAPGRGRKPTYDINKIAAIVNATLQTKPDGMTHWSYRTMAESQGVSKSTIHTIWQGHNLKPHRIETFKLSRDQDFGRNPPITIYMGVSVNIPLRIFDKNQGEKARTEIDITHAQRQQDAAQAQVFSDVDSAYFNTGQFGESVAAV